MRNLFVASVLSLPVLAVAQAYSYPNGSTVADFTVTDVNGVVHNLYDYNAEGKYVYLDFFTLWCVPCQETGPDWAALYQTYGCNTGELICLSLDYESNTAEEIQQYADLYYAGSAHPPVVSGALALSDVFGAGTAPNYCLIGPDHVMINNFVWPVSSVADLTAAFPVGSNVQPQSCAVGITTYDNSITRVFPNPTTGLLYIPDPAVVSACLSDATGHFVSTWPIHAGQLHLNGQAPGLYLLELYDTRGNTMGRQRVVFE